MYPCLSTDNTADSSAMNVKPFGKSVCALVRGPYFRNVSGSERGLPMPLSVGAAELVHHILHIVLVGTFPKVTGVAAPSVVAAMQSGSSLTYLPVFHDIREPVRLERSNLSIYPCGESAIPIVSDRSLPIPAVIRTTDIYLRPKSVADMLWNFISSKISGLHDLASLSGWGLSRTGDVPALPGLCFQDCNSHAH